MDGWVRGSAALHELKHILNLSSLDLKAECKDLNIRLESSTFGQRKKRKTPELQLLRFEAWVRGQIVSPGNLEAAAPSMKPDLRHQLTQTDRISGLPQLAPYTSPPKRKHVSTPDTDCEGLPPPPR